MKRWWYTPLRKTVRRVRPVVAGAVMAGALCCPMQSAVDAYIGRAGVPTVARTSGAVIDAWAFGTLAEARQPDSQAACDLSHVCALVISRLAEPGQVLAP